MLASERDHCVSLSSENTTSDAGRRARERVYECPRRATEPPTHFLSSALFATDLLCVGVVRRRIVRRLARLYGVVMDVAQQEAREGVACEEVRTAV